MRTVSRVPRHHKGASLELRAETRFHSLFPTHLENQASRRGSGAARRSREAPGSDLTRERLDITPRGPILVELWHHGADLRLDGGDLRRDAGGCAQIERLRRDDEL